MLSLTGHAVTCYKFGGDVKSMQQKFKQFLISSKTEPVGWCVYTHPTGLFQQTVFTTFPGHSAGVPDQLLFRYSINSAVILYADSA
jgi:hypothetical protein